MGFLKILALAVAALAVLLWHYLSRTSPIPQVKSSWWGPGQPRKVDESIRPFTINVSDSVLKDLHAHLESTPNLTPPLEGVGFEYGFNSKYLEEVLEFWRTKYNWREREKFLNQFPQFKTTVSGLDLHFLWVKPSNVPQGVQVVPLLLLHGFPGSVRMFYSLIPLLTTPRDGFDFVFEVVVPSLPGIGFSDGASKPGLDVLNIAVVMKDLMQRLGYKRFYVQAGNWGPLIGTSLAILYPERILGFHSNPCSSERRISLVKNLIGSFWPSLFVEDRYAHKVFPYWEKFFGLILEEMGYLHIQATKPDTIGTVLRTTPVGLAAYLLEKFSSWTDMSWRSLPDGGLTRKYTLTDLLDNVMIYWVSGSITTAVRLYAEHFSKASLELDLDNVLATAPTACAQFANELTFTPESMVRDKYTNLVRYTVMPEGGHFAAFEMPHTLSDDVWESARLIRQLSNKK